MIAQLTIQNFGLISRLEVDFYKGLNIFTGETGAGKSILIDALRYALGERLNIGQVRDIDKPCIVEIMFEPSETLIKESRVISEFLIDNEPILIIHRSRLPDGKTRNKINGLNVTVSQLKTIGNELVDFHGPHDHQMLLQEYRHIDILDRLSDLVPLKKSYTETYTGYLNTKKKLDELEKLFKDRLREEDFLGHQIKELEQVPLDTAKYEELLEIRSRINNAEKLHEHASQLINILENDEAGISGMVQSAFQPVNALNQIDESTSGFSEILTQVQNKLSELTSTLTDYIETLSFHPGEAEDVNLRYDIYYKLLRKYGGTIDELKSCLDEARQKYELLSELEGNDKKITAELGSMKDDLKNIADKITLERKKTAVYLEGTIKAELKELGIKHVQFECRIGKTELSHSGQDKVVFYISPNAGEDMKPLAEIVSSGEAARVMLALKKALTKVDPIPVLIFDEIDAQIGGRLGTIVGKKLKELSLARQVLLITHLPQIASFGDHHFKVSKNVRDNRTVTNVSFLDPAKRVTELAKMMSGEKESRIALNHAHDMLTRAKAG